MMCGCGWRGGPGVRGFATVVSLICGGWVPQDLVFVARPLSKIERCQASPGAHGGAADWLCAMPGGSGRLVSRNGLSVAVSGHGALVLVRDGACLREGSPAWYG